MIMIMKILNFNIRRNYYMGRKKLEIKSGDKYGRLTIIEEVAPHIQPSGHKERRFRCKCDPERCRRNPWR